MRKKNAPDHLFEQIKHESLAGAAVAQIESLILSGVLREGDMLPGERELASQLGISRPKVREALKSLADHKLLTIVAGEGVYVDRLGGEVMSSALISLYNRTPSAIRENLEYRRLKEGFSSRLAAKRATSLDRDQLQLIIEKMSSADHEHDHQRASELDLELHSTIAFAAHNCTLTHMMTALYSLNKSALFYNRSELLNVEHAGADLFQQHQDIVTAIRQSNPSKAEKAAQNHIDFVIDLVETALERRARESLASKRYRTPPIPR